jgi:hypothetical protein
MGFSFGLHVAQDYDLPAMMASPQMQQIYGTVLEVGIQYPNGCGEAFGGGGFPSSLLW